MGKSVVVEHGGDAPNLAQHIIGIVEVVGEEVLVAPWARRGEGDKVALVEGQTAAYVEIAHGLGCAHAHLLIEKGVAVGTQSLRRAQQSIHPTVDRVGAAERLYHIVGALVADAAQLVAPVVYELSVALCKALWQREHKVVQLLVARVQHKGAVVPEGHC